MIDIHCHILYGLDDGAKDLEESVEMARIAYMDGVRHVIATPHYNIHNLQDKELILRRIEHLQNELERLGLELMIHPGNEVRIDSPAFVEEHMIGRKFHYLGKPQKFILLEQRWESYEAGTLRIVEQLLDQGVRPIIPHPERHHYFRQTPELLIQLIEAGAWTQVTVDSLIGNNGPEAQSFGDWLSDKDYIHTIATDAHNIMRKPNLSLGYDLIRARKGKSRADEIIARAEQILT